MTNANLCEGQGFQKWLPTFPACLKGLFCRRKGWWYGSEEALEGLNLAGVQRTVGDVGMGVQIAAIEPARRCEHGLCHGELSCLPEPGSATRP